MMPPDLPPATSASQLQTYATCPRKFFFQYVAGTEPEFRSTSLILGSAIHSSVAWFFEEKLAGRTPTTDAARVVLAADLAACVEGGTQVRWKDKTPGTLEDVARRLLDLYLTRFGDLEVASVEQPFEVDLEDPETGECLPRALKGFFDLVRPNHGIIELKTSSRGWASTDLSRHLQVGAYAFAWNQLHGGPCQVDLHVLVKLKREPRIETYEIRRGESETRWWFEAARGIETAIHAGHFPPAPSPLCAECEYERACAGWLIEPAVLPTNRRLPVVESGGCLAFA